MRGAMIDAIKTYSFMTLLTFCPIILGWFLSKFSDGEKDENGENLLDDLSIGFVLLGVMFGIFWLILTAYWLYYFIVDKPLTPDRIKELIQLWKTT